MPSTTRSSGKLQFVRFVKGDFERACNDLGAAGQTLRRREDDRQILRFDPAILRDLARRLLRAVARLLSMTSVALAAESA